ncbi:MAG: right-handed parallel beta-helix repeat-containing protein [Candidatus Dormibacteria bacterium]|jgi:predicted outer membrane repeat protein
MNRTAIRVGAGVCASLSAAFVVAAFVSTSALAATYTVTTAADSGPGSLRAAIASADLAGGSNTIAFASSANGTIILTTGELEVTGSPAQTLTITGNGASNTLIDGDALSRVFAVDVGATLDLSGVTVENGTVNSVDGAGILVDGDLALSDSVITGNTQDSSLGGGVSNDGGGTVTVSQTTFSNNVANGASGAGMANNGDGTLNVLDSTFEGNSTDDYGGAILTQGGTVNITDSTFNNNASVLGAIAAYDDAGSITIVDSTLASNPSVDRGDDIYIAGGDPTITVTGSILTDHGAGQSCSAAVTDGGFNIDNGTSCGFMLASDHTSTNPDLGALASNGGPTQTMALDTGSPAIEAGQSETACTSVNDGEDQRGYDRPGVPGTACSIGAYEYGAAPGATPTPTPTSTPIGVPVPTTGAMTGSTAVLPSGILGILGIAAFLLIMGGLRARNRRPN